MNLTDSHIHLHFPQYDADRSEMIARAIRGGVTRFLNIGTDLDNSRKAIAVADEYPEVYAAVGFHPHETKHAQDAELAELAKLLAHPTVVAIGEVGLAGELRAVSGMSRRIQEARRLGARAIILPASSEVVGGEGLVLRRCQSLVEAIAAARLEVPANSQSVSVPSTLRLPKCSA